MKLFDLHCDTLYETYHANENLQNNTRFHISLDKAKCYEKYCQIFAVWSDNKRTEDENYSDFFNIIEYNKKYLNPTEAFKYYIAVEGGKLLNGDITRLNVLYESGVRFLTLVWNGICCIGGSHDNEEGLFEFGKNVVRRCFELGIVPDLSHSSVSGMYDTLEIAKEYNKPVIATHSNSYTLRNHKRNLPDDIFINITKSGGIIGISLCGLHLTESGACDINCITGHIDYFLSLTPLAAKSICFGCDFDGISSTPDGIENISDMYKIAEALARNGYSDNLIKDIFYNNAESFIIRNKI